MKNGKAAVLRNGEESDGNMVLENFNQTHAETDYLLSYPDETSFDCFSHRKHGTAHCRYDDVGECNRGYATKQKEVPTACGETLSWEYLCYVREHPIKWSIPTCILYGGMDHLTSRETISEFSDRIGATLTVMEDGEHWFHTDAQMKVLDNWISNAINSSLCMEGRYLIKEKQIRI